MLFSNIQQMFYFVYVATLKQSILENKHNKPSLNKFIISIRHTCIVES